MTPDIVNLSPFMYYLRDLILIDGSGDFVTPLLLQGDGVGVVLIMKDVLNGSKPNQVP